VTKSAIDLMQEILVAAMLDGIAALKARSGGVPNNLLRDLGAIHANTTFADLPPELQATINASVRSAFSRLLKEGYSVSTAQPAPSPPRRESNTPRHDQRPRPPRREGPGGGRSPHGGKRPGGGGGGKGGGGRPKPRG